MYTSENTGLIHCSMTLIILLQKMLGSLTKILRWACFLHCCRLGNTHKFSTDLMTQRVLKIPWELLTSDVLLQPPGLLQPWEGRHVIDDIP